MCKECEPKFEILLTASVKDWTNEELGEFINKHADYYDDDDICYFGGLYKYELEIFGEVDDYFLPEIPYSIYMPIIYNEFSRRRKDKIAAILAD